MIESTWSKIYRRDSIPGLDEVAVVTGVLTNLPPGNKLVSDLTLRTLTGTVDVRIEVPLTPTQMRALSAILTASAQRVEDDLLPLLEPRAPDVIPFTLEPTPEAA